MEILFVAPECRPFVKVGALAEHLYGFSLGTQKKGHKVSVIIPMYKCIKDEYNAEFIAKSSILVGEKEKYLGIYHEALNNVDFYFIDNEEYFYYDELYNFANDGERAVFFCEAVLESLKILNLYPDIMHLFDWQTGIIPHLLKAEYKQTSEDYRKIKTVFTIRNVIEQGIFPTEMDLIINSNPSPILYMDGKINFMKAAIMEADYLTTVSPTFCDEILKGLYDTRLSYALKDRQQEFKGILNGIDYDLFNPETNKKLLVNYSLKETVEGNRLNKEAFKKLHNFPDKDVMLIAFIGKYCKENGSDLLDQTLEELINKTDAQFFFVAYGDENKLQFLHYLANKYPDRFKCHFGNSFTNSVQIASACDLLLQPYIYEPCNFWQLVATHFGSVCLIHEAGGLKDVVKPYNEYTSEGEGFSFINQTPEDFFKVFDLAYGLYRFNEPEWQKLMIASAEADHSWNHAIDLYTEIYEQIKFKKVDYAK